mmetsp:Transcript_43838/g.31941  ORF Transcript_43838/g.31941 Transcript_43838/m.31941 type:complete len:80 (-) Transcript_43838:295-534(-)
MLCRFYDFLLHKVFIQFIHSVVFIYRSIFSYFRDIMIKPEVLLLVLDLKDSEAFLEIVNDLFSLFDFSLTQISLLIFIV